MPTVSVIIATYNCAQYLPQALQSVFAQTYRDFGVIVVNDGSTDNTDEVIRQFMESHGVRYYRIPHSGVAKAKNAAIAKANGEYIAFLDADDFWEPTKLEKQLQVFRNNPSAGLVCTDVSWVEDWGDIIPSEPRMLFRGQVLPHLYGNNFVSYSSCMVQRALLNQCGAFDESLGLNEDYDLWLRLSLVTEFDYVPEKLAAYRVRDGQVSSDREARALWGRIIEDRFRGEHPAQVTRQMVKFSEWVETYVKFRRFETTRPMVALLAVGRLCLLRPLNWTPYRSLVRLIWVNVVNRIERSQSDKTAMSDPSNRHPSTT